MPFQNDQQQQIQIQLGNYKYNEKYCIGQGSFGKVYKGINILTNRQVAIKQMDAKQITQSQIMTEISILKQLRHPNIVEYEDGFKSGGFFYIVMQYCKNGDLREIFENSDAQQEDQEKQKKIKQVVKQVCSGFQYLKENNIIHRDLKPSNILKHQGYYKIADFGLAKTQSIHKSVINNDFLGVPIYMAPQLLSKNYYTYKCDVWSLGIIIYEMFFQILPWKNSDPQSLFFQIMKNPFPLMEIKKPIPKTIAFLLKNTLQYMQKDRLSWRDISQAISNTNELGQIDVKLEIKSSKSIKPDLYLPKQKQIHKSVPGHEAQVIHHLFVQSKSIEQQLIKVCSENIYIIFLQKLIKYLIEGQKTKSMFFDCIYMFLKTCADNLHFFLMDLESLQDGRDLLIFLELLHDFVIASFDSTLDGFKRKMSMTNRNGRIDQYAAQVISKINTYSAQREFQVIKGN